MTADNEIERAGETLLPSLARRTLNPHAANKRPRGHRRQTFGARTGACVSPPLWYSRHDASWTTVPSPFGLQQFFAAASAGVREANNRRTKTETEITAMKEHKLDSQLLIVVAALCVAIVSGCASPKGYKQADKTGAAINTLRNDVVDIKTAVDESMKALDGLQAAASTDPRKPYETFAKSVDKVEAAANTAKKDADEMRARGAAYFQQWEAELGTVKSEEIRQLAAERKAKLQQAFDTIKTSAQAAKE